MVPPELVNYFLASTGAGAALVGLLFVAVSIAPERTVMTGAPAERQAVAASTFTALLNPFFLSLYALIPHTSLGLVALILSLIGLLNSLWMAWSLLRHPTGWVNALRRTALVVVGLALYSIELYYAVLLLQAPTASYPLYALASLLGGIYALGLTRAWQLLGGRRYQSSDWLSPLRDLEDDRQPATNSDTSRSANKTKTD